MSHLNWASMCKHVAAVLYGIGARLDFNPMLFFELRDINSQELVKKSVEQKLESMLKNASKKSKQKLQKKIYQIYLGYNRGGFGYYD